MKKEIMLAYTIIHFIVDFSCSMLINDLITPYLVGKYSILVSTIIYNFFAFALQLPIGVLANKINKNALCAGAGCGLIVLAYMISKVSIVSCLIAGIGNAMFHVGGGIDVLNISERKATMPGIFASAGAMGIFLGSKIETKIFCFIVIFMLLLSILVLMWLYKKIKNKIVNKNLALPKITKKESIVIICLILTVFIRGYIELALNFTWKSNIALATLFTLGVVLGKMIGGFLGDKIGFTLVSVSSLIISAILFLGAFNSSICGILAILLFNITLPITLIVLANIFENNKGFAFGLLKFVLFIGALPCILRI